MDEDLKKLTLLSEAKDKLRFSLRKDLTIKDNMDIIKESEIIAREVINNVAVAGTQVDYNLIKQEIRDKLGKYFYHETDCKPIIITVINEV